MLGVKASVPVPGIDKNQLVQDVLQMGVSMGPRSLETHLPCALPLCLMHLLQACMPTTFAAAYIGTLTAALLLCLSHAATHVSLPSRSVLLSHALAAGAVRLQDLQLSSYTLMA